ncbi:MAG: right-handed parallel beta-helix repeat-containing protein, partial [candidate division WOR-3 bacterium]
MKLKKNVIVANSNYGCYFEATFFIPYPPELNPNLGTFQSPGLNAFISNEIGEVLNAIGGLNAVGNYWGSIHTSYVRNRIYNFFPSYTNFDPIAASDKYFSVTYPSYCSTDVIVTGDFTINSNASLNIKEGKTFYFTEKDDVAGGIASNLSELIIKGSINAYGNERDSIKFISYPYSEPIQLPIWYGIRVLENGRGNFTYCKIRGGFIGIYASSTDLLNIQTSKITDNELAGVYCENTSPSISYCDFTNNGVYGIYLNSLVPVSPGIYHNNISLWHRYGIYWDAPPSLSAHITGNVIKGYSSFPYPSFYGIYLTCSYPPTSEMLKISNNKVENFFQAGLYFQGFSNAILKDTNRIKHNQPYGIHCVNNSSPIIRWSEIDSNFSMDVIGGGIFVEGNSYPDLGRENDKGMNIIDTFNPIYVANLNPIPQNPIYAQYNWWGCSPPDTSRFIGWVIYYPWLTSPPWEEEFSSSQVSNLNKINSPVLNISPNIIK